MKKSLHTSTVILISILFTSLLTSCSKPTNACFTYSPTTITTTTDVIFNATCSENSSSYRWTFGDGTPEITSTSLTISHKYSTAGIYTVTLNAERKDGVAIKKGKQTITQTLTVQ